MRQYLDLCKKVLENGTYKDDRTGTGTYSLFGYQIRYNLEEGFPLVTTKKVFLRGIIHDLLLFISGDTNIKYLVDNDVHIWDDWAYKAYKESSEFEGEDMKCQCESFSYYCKSRIKNKCEMLTRWKYQGFNEYC
jgi:thymidylate synthase